jgi:hypothetical protein
MLQQAKASDIGASRAGHSVELALIKTHHSLRPQTQLDDGENGMPDKKLITLVALLIVLNFGHDADHIARGDLRWPLTVESAPPIIIVAIFSILVFGLYFYLKNKVGPLFWAIVAGAGAAFGWLAHFSPFTEQTPQYIFHAYETPAVGLLAVGWLVALMLALITTAVYAEYLWAKGLPR